jgi:hypothetical protein
MSEGHSMDFKDAHPGLWSALEEWARMRPGAGVVDPEIGPGHAGRVRLGAVYVHQGRGGRFSFGDDFSPDTERGRIAGLLENALARALEQAARGEEPPPTI